MRKSVPNVLATSQAMEDRGACRCAGRARRAKVAAQHPMSAPHFHVPEPPARPGEAPDFSYLDVPAAGSVDRPPIDVAAGDDPRPRLRPHPGARRRRATPSGRGRPTSTTTCCARGLRAMVTTRVFDERMERAQRQGKTSFYMRSTGEEAFAVAHALALAPGDMFFPTTASRVGSSPASWPLVDLMCQIFSNERDRLHGRQLPVLYSVREAGFFTVSGNLGTQFVQAVGWAMAAAIKGDTAIASGVVGDGTTAEADFHHALTFAHTYQRAGDPQRRQQPVGDLDVPGGRRRRRRRHVRGPGHRLRHPGPARRRQRLPRRSRGVALGGRAGQGRPRPDARRVGDLPRRGALVVGRPVAVPTAGRVGGVAAR